MAKFEIKGVPFEIDIFEADTAERFEKETEKIIDGVSKAREAKTLSSGIRMQCRAVFSFIDNLFGEGKSKAVFGEACNLKECLSVYAEINEHIRRDQEEIASLAPAAAGAKKKAKK